MPDVTGRIKFDEEGKRFFAAGVDRGVLFVNKSGVYQKGVAWNGLTSVQENPGGAEKKDLWADNIKYASYRGEETFGGTIECYYYPDEWMECDGSKEPVSGFQVHGQDRAMFALAYRSLIGSDTDGLSHGYKLHIVYGATANPSGVQRQTTNESPDAGTFSYEFDTTPVSFTSIDGYKKVAHVELDSTKVDSAKLKEIEDILYGVDADAEHSITAADSRLLMPNEIYTILTRV